MRSVLPLFLSFLFTFSNFLSKGYAQVADCSLAIAQEWKQSVPSSLGLAETLTLPDGGYFHGYNYNSGYGVIRFDAQGNELWHKMFEPGPKLNNENALRCMVKLSDGNILIGITIDFNSTLIKMNLQGDIIWEKALNNSSIQYLGRFLLLPDNHILIGGNNSSPSSYLTKIDEDGNIIWEKSFWDRFWINELQFLPDGNIIIAGENFPEVDFSISTSLFKIDVLGNIIWIKGINNNYSNTFEGLSLYPNGDITVATQSFRQNDNIFSTGTYENHWIAKVDLNGKITDRKSLNIPFGSLKKLVTLPNGNILAGNTSDAEESNIKSQSSIGEDYWLFELDENLEIIWDVTIIGQMNEKLTEMIIGPSGEIVLSGIIEDNSGEIIKFNRGDAILNTKSSLLLKNAQINENNIIQEIKDGDVLDLQQIGTDYFSLEIFNNVSNEAGSAFIQLEGPLNIEKTDNDYPYTLFGDYTQSTGNVLGRRFPAGEYTLSFTPYCQDSLQGEKGLTQTFSFQIINEINTTCKYAVEWDRTLGGKGTDVLRSIIELPDGGFLLGGSSLTDFSGVKGESTSGFYDYCIIKVDAHGNKIWSKNFGGELSDDLYDMLLLPDGSILLGGTSRSSFSRDKSQNSRGATDYWIVKIDQEGNKIWDKTIGGNRTDALIHMITLSDGNILLGGLSHSLITGEKSAENKGNSDYWIIKIDLEGNIIWDKAFGGDLSDKLCKMTLFPDGNILLGGESWSSISEDKSEENIGQEDFWLIKINEEGNIIWDKTYGSVQQDNFKDLFVQANGEIWLAGYSKAEASGDKSEDSQEDDFWILKLDSEGNLIKDVTFGGEENDRLAFIQPNEEGFLIGSSSDSPISNLDKTEDSRGEFDYWVVQMDQNANKIWDQTFGGSRNDYLQDLLVLSDGSLVLAGNSISGESFEKSEDNIGSLDFWVAKPNPSLAAVEPDLSLRLFVLDADQDANLQEIITEVDNIVWAPTTQSFALVVQAPLRTSSKLDIQLDGPINMNASFNSPPYALFGIDELSDDLLGRKLINGKYTLTLTYYCDSLQSTKTTKQFEFEIDNTLPRFVLVDADTEEDIQVIQEGDVIDLDQTNTKRVSIRAEVSTTYEGMSISEVEMNLKSNQFEHHKIEKLEPFALFGGEPRSNYYGRELLPNQYTISATPKFGDQSLTPIISNFELIGGPILNLDNPVVVNPNTRLISAFLSEDSIVNIEKANEGISIVAEGSFLIESVKFVVTDQTGNILINRIENLKPYALLGDTRLQAINWSYLPWFPEPGEYTLAVTGFSQDNAQGYAGKTKLVQFKIFSNTTDSNLDIQQVYLHPNPAQDVTFLHISLKTIPTSPTQLRLLDKQGQVKLKKTFVQQEYDLNIKDLSPGFYILEIANALGIAKKGIIIY